VGQLKGVVEWLSNTLYILSTRISFHQDYPYHHRYTLDDAHIDTLYRRHTCKKDHAMVLSQSNFNAINVMVEPFHSTRLGFALNFAVAKFDLRGDIEGACSLAKSTLDSVCFSLISRRI
jgi:hypothetical protein